MRKNFKQGKWVMLMLALAVWCVGCSDHDSSTAPSNLVGDFHPTPGDEIQARIAELKLLLPEETYNIITQKSRNNPECKEANREQLDLPDSPNGQWYYTYNNLIRGMAKWKEFANEEDENTRKLEIAAFLANIAQETGAKVAGDPFGSPGCAIQEGYGAARHTCVYGGCTTKHPMDWKTCNDDYNRTCPDGGAGYCGRGPHQLSYDYNYEAFGKAMGKGDSYLKDPDLLTKNPEIGIAGSIWFWGHEVRNQWSPPDTPFKPSAHDVIVGNWKPTAKDKSCGRTKADFGVIINIINGGVECCKCQGEDYVKKCCEPGCCKREGCPECCETIENVKEECRTPNDNATNRVNYFKAIAKEMGVSIPEDFLGDCSSQLNFANCSSY